MTAAAIAAPATGSPVTRWLERASPFVFTLYGGTAAFAAYFAMYAYRKPFSAATYGVVPGWHGVIDFKIALVIAQVAGYALSKVIGVKLIAEMGQRRRAVTTLGLILLAWAALMLFAVLPAPWNVAAMFLNGLPLGLIWGLVFSYVEGRRTSEVIGAILCASFILSSGVVKSAGAWLLELGVSVWWMPAATGLMFLPLLLISVAALAQLPPPDAEDKAQRSPRAPMDGAKRLRFFAAHAAALVPLLIAYVFLTAFRDFRDNFAAEIWRALGFTDVAALFTSSELPAALLSLVTMGLLIVVRDNRRALLLVHAAISVGALLIGGATLAYQQGLIDPIAWMILLGVGLYMAYTPFNAMLFDRMIAATRTAGNAGFLIYLADTCGYGGSIVLLLVRNFAALKLDWLNFFEGAAYVTALLCLAGALLSGRHFRSS